MGRILRSDPPSRARAGAASAAYAALADLEAHPEVRDLQDRLAFAGLALRELERSIDRTAEAWERRGYWLKADQFRRDWAWAGQGGRAIVEPLSHGDLPGARAAAVGLLPRLISARGARVVKAASALWAGAYDRLQADRRLQDRA